MAGEDLVLDASTAILLAKIGLLRTVVTPGGLWMAESAFREATVKDVEDARHIRQLAAEGLIRAERASGPAGKLAADFHLGPGETESILLAQRRSAVCGTDDGPAIRCLKVLGMPFTTALALLVVLTEAGRLPVDEALERLDGLERWGRYSGRILDDAAGRIRAVKPGRRGRKP